MYAYKITDDIRQELTAKGIVICTYKDTLGNEFNGIDLTNTDYAHLEIVDVQEDPQL